MIDLSMIAGYQKIICRYGDMGKKITILILNTVTGSSDDSVSAFYIICPIDFPEEKDILLYTLC